MANVKRVVAVVDDDESVCRAIKRLLQVAGARVDIFSGGDPFLRMLSSTPSYRPACVITDFEMPGINGLELLRHLAPTGVPVVFITANDAPAVRETAIASGAAGYLQKLFDGAVLIKAVEMALSGIPGLQAFSRQFTQDDRRIDRPKASETRGWDALTGP